MYVKKNPLEPQFPLCGADPADGALPAAAAPGSRAEGTGVGRRGAAAAVPDVGTRARVRKRPAPAQRRKSERQRRRSDRVRCPSLAAFASRSAPVSDRKSTWSGRWGQSPGRPRRSPEKRLRHETGRQSARREYLRTPAMPSPPTVPAPATDFWSHSTGEAGTAPASAPADSKPHARCIASASAECVCTSGCGAFGGSPTAAEACPESPLAIPVPGG